MKNASVKNGFGVGILIFAAAAIIALPVRTLQFFTILESGTGFYSKTDWSVWVLYAVIAAAIVSIVAFGMTKRKKLDYSLAVQKRPGMGVASFLAAAGVLLDSANSIIAVMNINETADEMSKPAAMLLCGQAIFAVLSAIYFLALGISYIGGKTNGSEYRLVSLAPVLWSIFRIVYRFTRTISYTRVSDLMLEMLMLAFMIMFFMAFAQVNSRVNSENCEWKIAAYGLPAALLALICFVPRLIVTLSGHSELLYSQSSAEFCDLGTALFIISTVTARVADRVTAIPDKTDEE